MNRKRLSTCLALAGLVWVPRAAISAGGGTAGAPAPAAAFFGARPIWKAEGNQPNALFGWSVATAGDVNGDGYADVIVGAPWYTNTRGEYEGGAFVYHGSASGPSTTADWTAHGDEYSSFGHSVAAAGDVNGDGYDDVVVGEPFVGNFEGRVFVYHGSASALSAKPNWTAESDQADMTVFGYSVGTAGDVNGDGYDDVIVGAPGYDNAGHTGRAFVYHGSASGLSAKPDWTAEQGEIFGLSVGAARDVNGDGYDDVIVGGWRGAFVYHGSASGLSTMPDWTAESPAYGLGGTAGDVNGDGYDDVIVGAGGDCLDYNGGASVYHGSASGLSTRPSWTAESNQEQACFGYSAGTAGDVNGDGYDDVVVGAERYDNGQSDEGGVVVYFGSASGLATRPYWTAESDQAEALFGYSVGTAGDVNGDGYDDGIASAVGYDVQKADEGVVVVFGGRATPAMPRQPFVRQ